MSLKIPYRKYPAPNAPSGFCYAASVPVNIGLPAKNAPRSKRFDAIIDSGASACLFHASIGRAIGLDIEKGTKDQALGITGAEDIFLHEITLYIPGGPIKTVAGFSESLSIRDCLEWRASLNTSRSYSIRLRSKWSSNASITLKI